MDTYVLIAIGSIAGAVSAIVGLTKVLAELPLFKKTTIRINHFNLVLG